MLISNRHHFIFIHIYKNAGTSISAARCRIASTTAPTGWRSKLPNASTCPCLRRSIRIPWRAMFRRRMLSRARSEKYDSYFSFAIVTNPVAWESFDYSFMLKDPGAPSTPVDQIHERIYEYIRWRCADDMHFQKDFIFSPDGAVW